MTYENVRNGQTRNGTGKNWQPLTEEVLNGTTKAKSYYAASVEDAISQARAEIGQDAILLHSRKTPLELRHLGAYEVVFSGAVTEGQAGPRTDDSKIGAELLAMRRQIQELQHTLSRRARSSPPAAGVAGAAQQLALERLDEIGVDPELAVSIVEAASVGLGALLSHASPVAAVSEVSRDALDTVLAAEMMQRVRFAPPGEGRGSTAKIVAFIGPPGVGKTTSLVKLAVRRSESANRPIHFISADSHRVGAAEQLRTFASILGAGMELVDSPRLLAQTIEANLHREMILIDTPGLSGEDFELLNDLADYLGGRVDIEKHLVLPATMRFHDMQRVFGRYEAFQPGSLLFTHLDETDCFGPLYSAAASRDRSLSFFSGGQQIPEDLQEATEKTLMELLFRRERREGEGRDSS